MGLGPMGPIKPERFFKPKTIFIAFMISLDFSKLITTLN